MEFLRTVVAGAKGTEDEQEIEFLKKMLTYLDENARQGAVAWVKASKLLGVGE
jgi:hypothetical protein